jgi:hypothetical protein
MVSGKSEDAVTGPNSSLPSTSMADIDAPPADPATEQVDTDTAADIDEVWTSSRTARQIYSLGLVEKVRALGWALIHARRRPARRTSAGCSRSRHRPSPCSRSRRQTGRTTTCRRATSAPSSSSSRRPRTSRRSTCAALPLPSVLRLKECPQRIQENLRASLAHIRHSRISPRAAMAPPPGAVPPTLGVGLPALAAAGADADVLTELGLQEGRGARGAWRGLKNALVRLQAAQAEGGAPADQEMQSS